MHWCGYCMLKPSYAAEGSKGRLKGRFVGNKARFNRPKFFFQTLNKSFGQTVENVGRQSFRSFFRALEKKRGLERPCIGEIISSSPKLFVLLMSPMTWVLDHTLTWALHPSSRQLSEKGRFGTNAATKNIMFEN